MSFRLLYKGKLRLLTAIGGLLLLPAMPGNAKDRGRKYKPPPETATIKVTVLRGTNGKPVPNAAVIFHPIKDGNDDGALEMKSDHDGQVKIDVIPVGDTVRLQVIADGWRTYGQDYQIDANQKDIVVKLQRPSAQVSAYGEGPPSDQAQNAPKGQSSSAKPNDQTPLPQ